MKTILFLLLTCSIGCFAQSEEQDVRSAVLDYVEGFYEGDTLKIKRSILPEVNKYGYYQPKDSQKYAGEPMSFKEMIQYADGIRKKNRPAPKTAPKEIQIFDVQDQTASAKLTAWWGTDYILLAKYNGKWMIVQVLWQSVPKKK
ncbi:hypothetical protein WSM22_32780 [Cytophagales bacterium WSM2-2]|nr:hypothetical protein WSM22_32780 [Cytophagales bacterium WSM2-2]